MNTAIDLNRSVARTMQYVLLALLPGCLVFLYQHGWGAILNILLCTLSAVAFESIAQQLRKRSVKDAIGDYSALVTGLLIALCLPPLLPWWLPVLATGFAILLAKHAFGGIGFNLFNPAMVGYAMVLISFPRDLSLWLTQPEAFSESLTTAIKIVLNGGLSALNNWDAMTGATALDQHRTLRLSQINVNESAQNIKGLFGALHSEWINLAFFTGGVWMLFKKVINWHIPVAFLVSLSLCIALHNVASDVPMSLQVHLFGGATMLCAFFIATDPVSAAANPRGRLIYAAIIGLLVYLIRAYGAYPDAVAFAVLLANCTVATIDRIDIGWQSAKR